MTKILFPIIIFCVFSACTRSTTLEKDSDQAALSQNISEKAHPDQGKVIGDIQFGMSEKRVKPLLQKFEEETRKASGTEPDALYSFIGDYKYSSIRGAYHNDKLYWFKISGYTILWEYYDAQIPKAVSSAADILTKRFGEPNLSNPIPERYSMEKGFTYTLHQWDVGTKRVQVRVEDMETSYSVNIYIYQPKVVEEIEESDKNARDSISKANKDIF